MRRPDRSGSHFPSSPRDFAALGLGVAALLLSAFPSAARAQEAVAPAATPGSTAANSVQKSTARGRASATIVAPLRLHFAEDGPQLNREVFHTTRRGSDGSIYLDLQ